MSNPYWYGHPQYGMVAPQPVPPPTAQPPPPPNQNWGWNPYPNYAYPMQQYPQQYYPPVPPQQYCAPPQSVPQMGPESVPPISSQQGPPQPVPPMSQPPSQSLPQPVPQIESKQPSQNGPQPVPPPPMEQLPTRSPSSEVSGFHTFHSEEAPAASHENGPQNVHPPHNQMPSTPGSEQHRAQIPPQPSYPQIDHQQPPPPQHDLMSQQPQPPQMIHQQPPQPLIMHQQQPPPQMMPQQPPPQMMPQQPAPQMTNQQPPPPQMSHQQPPQPMMSQQPPNQMMPQQPPQQPLQQAPQQPPHSMMPQPPPHPMMPQPPPQQMMPQQPPQMMQHPGPQGPPPPWHQQSPPPQYNHGPNYNQYNQNSNFNQPNNYNPHNQGPNYNQNNQAPNYNQHHQGPNFNQHNQGPNYHQHNHGPNSNQYKGGFNNSYDDNQNQYNGGSTNYYNKDSYYEYNNNNGHNNNSFEREPWASSQPARENFFETQNDSFEESPRKRSKRGCRGGRRNREAQAKKARLEMVTQMSQSSTVISTNDDYYLEEYKHLIEEAERDAEVEQDATFSECSPPASPNRAQQAPEKVIVNDAVPIPAHLKGAVPRTGTTLSSPVVYKQGKPESHENNIEESPQNIYSLANKYNSVCLERTEGFVDKRQPKLSNQPPKLPPPRRFNFEDPTSSKLFCFMCRVECANEMDFMTHFSGRKHLKNEANFKLIDANIMEQIAMKTYKISPEFNSNIKCNICEQTLPNVDLFKTHLNGFKHQHTACSFLTRNAPIPELQPEYGTEVDEERKKKILQEVIEYEENIKKGSVSTVVTESKAPKTGNVLIGEKFVVQHRSNPNMWYCRLCKVNLSPSPSVQTEHCRGRQHRNNFIYKMSDSDNEAFKIFNGEIIPLVERTNWEEDCKHYSAQPNTLIAFESFRNHPSVPRPMVNNQIFLTNKKACPMIDFLEEDNCLEKKSSEITNGKSAIHELYELVKYISKVAYKITYAINEILLEFQASDSEEVRFQKSLDTVSYKVANGLLIKQIENLPKNPSCYYATVVRTDIIGKGYILNNEDKIDLVMICDFLPTKEILKLYEVGFTHILNSEEDRDRSITVMGDWDNSSISILYMTEDLNPIIELVLHITSKLYSNRDLTQLRQTPNLLNIDKGLYSLAEIRQMRWFKEKHIYYPYFMFVIRILRDFRRRNDAWRPLSLYSLELVLDHLLRNCKTFVSPAVLLKNFFRFFATVTLNTQTMFGDVCEVDYSNPFKDLTDSQCEAIQRSATNTLFLIENRKMNSVLYYPIPTQVKE